MFASLLALSRPLLEPFEARDAEIARVLLASGSWSDVDRLIEARGGSSSFTVAASALGQALFGPNEFGARFVTVVAFATTAILVLALAREVGAGSSAPLAALAFILSPLAAANAGFLSPDAVSAAAQSLGVLAALRLFHARGPVGRWRWVLYLAFGFAAVAKGALGLIGLIPVLAVAVARRRRNVASRLWSAPAALAGGIVAGFGIRFSGKAAGGLAGMSHTTALLAILAALLPWSIFCPRLVRVLREWWKTGSRRIADSGLLLAVWIGGGVLATLAAGSERLFCGTPLLVPLAVVFSRVLPGVLRPLKPRCAVALATGLALAFVLAAAGAPRLSKLDDAPRELGRAIRAEADGGAAILDATGFGLSSVGFYAGQERSITRLPRSSVLGVPSPAGLRDREVAPVGGASRTFLLVRAKDAHGLEAFAGYVHPHRDVGGLSLFVVDGIR